MSEWQLIEDKRLNDFPIDEAEGELIAVQLQEEWAKQHPNGFHGRRCIFKWDEGKFYYADIPVRSSN